jgi:hypothetical protein
MRTVSLVGSTAFVLAAALAWTGGAQGADVRTGLASGCAEAAACGCDPCAGAGCGGLFGGRQGGLLGHNGDGCGSRRSQRRYDNSAWFNCGCNGSYKYPVPPLYTYHWPGLASQQLMTDYHSPWRFPPLRPYTDDAKELEMPVETRFETPARLPVFRPAISAAAGSQIIVND